MWIARDKDWTLFLYETKPTKGSRSWKCEGRYYSISMDLFPEVKWEDEEPYEIILKLINDEQL